MERHTLAVNNPNFADIQLVVGKKTVFALSAVLSVRCPKLAQPDPKKPIKKVKGLLKRDAKEKENILIDLLKYVYTDVPPELDKQAIEDLLLLNIASIEYELPRLQWMIEDFVEKSLSLQNVFSILSNAHRAKQSRIKNICFHFIAKNYAQVIGDKTGAQVLGIELFQEMVNECQSLADFKPIEKKPCPPSTIAEDYKKIYSDLQDAPPDEVTLFRVGNVLRSYVPCHRGILSAQTPQLNALCNIPLTAKSKTAPEFILVPPLRTKNGFSEDVSSQAFECMLKYVYYGEEDIPPPIACELIAFATDYGMKELRTLCFRKLRHGITKESVMQVLSVTYIDTSDLESENVKSVSKLRKLAIGFIIDNIAHIDISTLAKKNPNVAADILLDIQKREKVKAGIDVQEDEEEYSKDAKEPRKSESRSKLKKDKKEKSSASLSGEKKKKEKKEKKEGEESSSEK